MQERLIKKLQDYIRDNNPDLLLLLLEENRLEDYLQENVASLSELITALSEENKSHSIIEELCMEELTKPLRPSRYNYLFSLLEEEFTNDFERLQQKEILTTELINMITACDPVFDEMQFTEENENDRCLRYAVTGAIHEYLNSELE